MAGKTLPCISLFAALALVLAWAGPAKGSTTGTIVGEVRDAQSGEGLAEASIVLEGHDIGAATDSAGRFSITNVPPGRYQVIATLVGRSPGKTVVDVTMDQRSRVDIRLAFEEIAEAAETVTAPFSNPDATQTVYELPAELQPLTNSAPNSVNQIPSTVSALPGITQDSLGNVHIQGARLDETGWMIEGIPVTTPVDNAFGTNLVTVGMSHLQVYTGGYPAQFGNATGGVINEVKKTGSDVRGTTLEGTFGSQKFLGAYLETGNVTPRGLDYFFGNYSWRSDFEKVIVNYGRSSDSVLKLAYPLSPANKLTFIAQQGTAHYGIPLLEPEYLPDQNGSDQTYALLGMTFSRQTSPDSYWLLRPYYLNSANEVRALSTQFGYGLRTRSIQRGIQLQTGRFLGPNHEVTAGLWNISASNHYESIIPGASGAETWYFSRVPTRQLAIFAQDKMRLSSQWALEAGVRFDRMAYRREVMDDRTDSLVSPRIGITWSENERSVLRATLGRYVQFAPTSLMDQQFTDPTSAPDPPSDPAPQRSVAVQLAWDRQVSDSVALRLAPFYRTYSDLVDPVYMGMGSAGPILRYENVGKASSRGVEAYLEHKMGRNTRGWISYTYMRARGMDIMNPGTWTWVDFDQRHTFTALIEHKAGRMHGSLRVDYRSGLPWTDYDEDLVMNTRRLSDNLVVTAGIGRSLDDTCLGGKVSLDVYNLFNSSSLIGRNPDFFVQPRFFSVSYSRGF